ncbi:hypothetical protein CYMTET_46311 [Cymbomonas tetramitiformis]|uniref:Myb-like domain-containing protein n=1 Tax=Cymbomonas tetramitiformis TaxID=36881 RepID=A0AAE0BWE0_9CHLO|nr:hypothetical protein CYMTET_46311 [Cymbomonas tetramitiformis]
MDIRDILGIKGDAVQTKAKAKDPSLKKPEGVSREVWQITQGFSYHGDGAPPVVPTGAPVGLKEKRKTAAKKVNWQWKPFTSSARSDGLQLNHWVKANGGGGVGSNGGDVGGDYAFAKYNKKVDIVKYSDEEYAASLIDDKWTREETDHLFDLCERYDLRFVIIADRYALEARTCEDLKQRYYSVAKKLLEQRGNGAEETLNHPIVRQPFNSAHERERKRCLEIMLGRTPQQLQEEAELMERARVIEEERRKREAILPSPKVPQAVTPHALATTPSLSASPSGRSRIRGQSERGGEDRLTPVPLKADDSLEAHRPVRSAVEVEEFVDTGPLSLGPLGGAKPEPGVYLRSKFTATAASSVALLGAAPRISKRVDQVLDELGIKALRTPTRATTRLWLQARTEAATLLELRKQRSRQQEALGVAAQPSAQASALAATTVVPAYNTPAAQAVGAPSATPKAQRSARVAGAVDSMSTPMVTEREVVTPNTGTDPKNSNKRGGLKRKVPAPARFEDSPPRRTDKRPRVGRKVE